MGDNVVMEDVEFDGALYQKNLQENTFADLDELDGVGGEEYANNEC